MKKNIFATIGASALAEEVILFAVGKTYCDGFYKLSHRLFFISVASTSSFTACFLYRWLSLSKPPIFQLYPKELFFRLKPKHQTPLSVRTQTTALKKSIL